MIQLAAFILITLMGFLVFMGLGLFLALPAFQSTTQETNPMTCDIQQRKSIIFELYRYCVCFMMMIAFAVSGFSMLNTALQVLQSDGELASATQSAVAVVFFALIWGMHWKLNNPFDSEETKTVSA